MVKPRIDKIVEGNLVFHEHGVEDIKTSNSTRSTTASSYTLTVDTWYRARLVVNSNATRVDFYLFNSSGTQLWTDNLTTNIPTSSGRNTGAGVVATNSGTTATLLCYLDWMAVWFDGRALTG